MYTCKIINILVTSERLPTQVKTTQLGQNPNTSVVTLVVILIPLYNSSMNEYAYYFVYTIISYRNNDHYNDI